MLNEIDIAGILVAPFVGYFVAAVGGFLLLRKLLVLVGFERLVWHPQLAQCGVFLAVLAALVLYY